MNLDLNPKNFQLYFNLTRDSYTAYNLDNTFAIFKSVNKIIMVIYGNIEKSIISYNLINKQKINEIKNAHQNTISNIRHHLDIINKRDLFLTISARDYNVKVWNMNNYECLLNLNNIHYIHSKNYGHKLYSACFLIYNNQNYIITSDCSDFIYTSNSDPIKIFDLNGNKINEIKHTTNNNTLFIDTYFDEKNSNNYILTGNYGFVESYDYNNNRVYHKYTHYNNSNKYEHTYSYESLIISTLDDINNEKKTLKLIATCSDGHIKFWNFHSGEMLQIIKVFGVFLHSICLININFLAVGCGDKSIKIVDIKKGKVIKVLFGSDDVICIKIFIHPSFGICLISQEKSEFYGINNNHISLWVDKKFF